MGLPHHPMFPQYIHILYLIYHSHIAIYAVNPLTGCPEGRTGLGTYRCRGWYGIYIYTVINLQCLLCAETQDREEEEEEEEEEPLI